MNRIKQWLLFVSLFICIALQGQSLTGVWEGSNGLSSFYIKPERVVLELYEYNDSITGVSHLYYSRGRYEHHKLSGWIDKAGRKVYLSEDSIISYKMGFLQTVDEGVYILKLIKKEDAWIMQGDWTSKKKRIFVNPSVSTYFRKEINQEPALPVVTDNGSKVNPRVDDIQMVIEVDKKEKDSIRVDMYDNGEIDGDSISVYVNDRAVITNQAVTAKPFTFYLSVTNNNAYDKIRMVAENLGSIPPNTALMVITTRKKKYNVFVSSSLEKNAVVEFFLKDK